MNNQEMELYRAAALTFEELGFMCPLPKIDEAQAKAEIEASAVVEFQGPFSGKLVVALRGDVLQPLAANMLGEDDVPTESQQCDALGEIANVVCGNVLPRIGGCTEVFRLGAPATFLRSAPADCRGATPATHVSLPLETGLAELCLFVNGDSMTDKEALT
jgi:hypothetical protein